MPALPDSIDPDGLLEYSVVYTDRSLNHMSMRFRQTMQDLHALLTEAYNARSAVIVPGGGTFGMEAIARQFARDKRCLIVRNGWFSYRWTQILEQGESAAAQTVLAAVHTGESGAERFQPAPIEHVIAEIESSRPEVVFAPHVETSAGLMLPDDYIAAVAEAVHAVGGLFVLDGIASGAVFTDMQKLGVDVLVSAPQKGMSSTPCAGLILLGERGVEALAGSSSDSFAMDLAKWHAIMQAYLDGGHAYHATMPTDGLVMLRDALNELKDFGFGRAADAQRELGRRVRDMLIEAGFTPIAEDRFAAPGVVVCHTVEDRLHNGSAFAELGMQIAAGVPLQVGEGPSFKTFRIGLFGLDKLKDVDGAVTRFQTTLQQVLALLDA